MSFLINQVIKLAENGHKKTLCSNAEGPMIL